MNPTIVNNSNNKRFETTVDGMTAYIRYEPFEWGLDLVSTYVPVELRGQRIGADLARYACEYAKDHHLKLIPSCHFIKVYLRRHPEYQSLEV